MLCIKSYEPEKICLIFEKKGKTPLKNQVILISHHEIQDIRESCCRCLRLLYTGADLQQNLVGGGQSDKGANDKNLGGGNVTKVPIIDEIDKFFLKRIKIKRKTAPEKYWRGGGGRASGPPGSVTAYIRKCAIFPRSGRI